MLLFPTFTPRFKSSSVPMVFFAVLCLLCFGVANGLASQNCSYQGLYYWVTGTSRTSSPVVNKAFWIGDPPISDFEKWPFLQNMQRYTESTWNFNVYYDYQYSWAGSNKYPWCYTPDGYGSFTIPDDWSRDDFNSLVVDAYNNLTPSQQAVVTSPVCGTTTKADGSLEKWCQFNTRPVGTAAPSGGVYTYGPDGVPTLSYPDNTGYASGYKLQPDGSYTPIYYTIDNGTVTEFSEITPPSYDDLTIDSETGNYSLSIPNYNKQLDKIINKLDNITLHVPTPEVTVNPEINLTPEVTVNVPAPEVTVELPDTISDSLTAIEGSLSTIVSNTSVTGSVSSAEDFSDLEMTSEEQSLVQDLVSWETNIPLIGEAVDFGLTAIMGKIPSVGIEYVWLDYTIGGGSSAGASGRRGFASFSNPLNGYRVLVSLANYQDLLLATRGTFILFEALYFVILIFKLIHKALLV